MLIVAVINGRKIENNCLSNKYSRANQHILVISMKDNEIPEIF